MIQITQKEDYILFETTSINKEGNVKYEEVARVHIDLIRLNKYELYMLLTKLFPDETILVNHIGKSKRIYNNWSNEKLSELSFRFLNTLDPNYYSNLKKAQKYERRATAKKRTRED